MDDDHEGGSGLPVGLTPPLTVLVGREREFALASELVRGGAHRLVTLTGPGGVGKTHLALHLAHVVRGDFPYGVVAPPLASVRDPALVLPTVAQAVGVNEGERTLLERVVERLSARRCLLVLDNFEHLLPAAPLASRLVAACPALVVLATSRAALRVTGERVVPLDPLPLPDESGTVPGADVWQNPAVRLFVVRARAAGANVPATIEMATAIVGICRRLDGLPLAIELAAAQVPALPPPEMLRRLPRPLSLLVDGPTDAPDRLRTMRDAISWSYDLLTPEEQALFRRCSIFVGGFGLHAVEALASGWTAEIGYPLGGHEIYEHWGPAVYLGKEAPNETATATAPWQPAPLDPWPGDPLRGVAALARHSLLRVSTAAGDDTSYQMLETIREFGLERQAAAGETEATAHAHAAYFTSRAERIGFGMWGPESRLWGDRALVDLGNMRAALAWGSAQPEAANQLALRLTESLWPFWQSRGHASEGRTHLEAAIARPGGTPVARASAMNVAAFLAWVQADDARALELLDAALPVLREHGYAIGIGRALFFTAFVSWRQGQIERMVACAHEALAHFAMPGDKIGQGVCEVALAIVARGMGDTAQAQERLERARQHFELVELPWGIATARYYEGELARDQGHRARAATILRESLTIYHAQGDPWGAGGCIAAIAALAAAGGDRERAARLFGAAFAMANEAGVFLPPTEFDSYQRIAMEIREAMGADVRRGFPGRRGDRRRRRGGRGAGGGDRDQPARLPWATPGNGRTQPAPARDRAPLRTGLSAQRGGAVPRHLRRNRQRALRPHACSFRGQEYDRADHHLAPPGVDLTPVQPRCPPESGLFIQAEGRVSSTGVTNHDATRHPGPPRPVFVGVVVFAEGVILGVGEESMQDVKYYEQGRVPGDALWVLNSIEHQREWAIVLDHTDAGNYFNPAGPNWQVFVNGVLVSTCDSRWEAGLVMQDYLDGACWIPGLPRSSHRRRRRRRVRLARATG